MKKIALILAAVLLLGLITGCEPTPAPATDPSTAPTQIAGTSEPTDPTELQTQPTETVAPEDDTLYITSDEVDLRQIVVNYMYAMANVQWTAGAQLDYSKYGASNLIYETGKTYLGMVYNNNATGLEMFLSVLDKDGQHIGTETGWNEAAGNSCATSVKHAWQQISTTAGFTYSADMMPCYRYSGVVAIGNIDWSVYDRTNTKTAIEGNKREDILEAYALTLPGDALVRHLGDAGGHALMVTKAPTVVRNADGSINLVDSFLYLTDQNNNLNNKREYPSSWTVDAKVSFSSALQDGYLPVTVAELRDGKTVVPVFEFTGAPTAEALAGGTLSGTVKSNYCLNTVTVRVLSGGEVVAEVSAHPYADSFRLAALAEALNLAGLPGGEYTLTVDAAVGLDAKELFSIPFSK